MRKGAIIFFQRKVYTFMELFMSHWELLGRVYDVFCVWYYISLSLAPCRYSPLEVGKVVS